MLTPKALGNAALALCLSVMAVTPIHASSIGVSWNVYLSPQGARLTYMHTASFLGSDEVSRTLLFSAICNPSEPTPYVTALIRPSKGIQLHPRQNMKIRMEDGNDLFLLGNLDRLASVNAGDNLTRYGITIPIDSSFFRALTKDGSQFFLRIDADPGDGGIQLKVKDLDRQKIRSFLETCQGFVGANLPDARDAESPNACRDYLNGPNSYADNVATNYGDEIVDAVCGSYRMDFRPALCMHILMSGAVPLNRQRTRSWLPEDAAFLCHEALNPGMRVNCFNREFARAGNLSAAIDTCKTLN